MPEGRNGIPPHPFGGTGANEGHVQLRNITGLSGAFGTALCKGHVNSHYAFCKVAKSGTLNNGSDAFLPSGHCVNVSAIKFSVHWKWIQEVAIYGKGN